MNNNLQLVETICDRITTSTQQRITFADYMELVLYDPQFGYYASNADCIGKSGDFITSPHLAPEFGELLAIQIKQLWEILGSPDRFSIVEMGAGQGLLAVQILEYLQRKHPEFFGALEYLIVETAPAMIAAQQQRLNALPVRWCEWSEIGDRSIVGCFISNELIDALPVHQVIVENGRLQELYVTVDRDSKTFAELVDELSTDRLKQYWQLNNIDLLSDKYSDGYRTEVNLAALDWLKLVEQKLDRGYIISIDYGYSADRYYNPIRSQGTLQCYYEHYHHNDPYIDFTAIQNQGELLGLETIGFTKQGMFLMALGLGDRISTVSSSSSDIQTILTRRQNLHQLIDPMGVGKFGILIQSKGLTPEERSILLTGLSMG
jgi:SAM-dependent MidA family methyltransferase